MANKKLKVAAVAVFLSLAATTALAVTEGKGFFTANAFGGVNEYGCVQGCTGEYYISDVKAKLIKNPDLNGSENVRFRVKYIAEKGSVKWFQDMSQDYRKSEIDANIKRLAGFVVELSGSETGIKYQPGDTVQLSATVSYETIGAKTLRFSNMVVYGVNGKVNTAIIPPVHYLD